MFLKLSRYLSCVTVLSVTGMSYACSHVIKQFHSRSNGIPRTAGEWPRIDIGMIFYTWKLPKVAIIAVSKSCQCFRINYPRLNNAYVTVKCAYLNRNWHSNKTSSVSTFHARRYAHRIRREHEKISTMELFRQCCIPTLPKSTPR